MIISNLKAFKIWKQNRKSQTTL